MLAVGYSELVDIHGRPMNMLFSEQRNIHYKYTKPLEIAVTCAFLRNWMQGASMMLRKDFLDVALPMPQGATYHDYWLALLASIKDSIAYIEVPINRFRQHGNNTSGRNETKKNVILTWLSRRFNPDTHPDRVAMFKAILDRVPDLSAENTTLLNDAVTYYTRQKTFIGRLRNIGIEMKYGKLFYSI